MISGVVDDISLEVFRYKFDGIADEMQLTLLKSAFSPIVKEGLDASSSIFLPNGDTLSQACSIPIHLSTLIPSLRAILDRYPVEQMRDGDVYVMNDPYLGGTHLPDVSVVVPVVVNDKVVALTATMSHHQDMGGMTPGSVPTTATEIYQEGFRIPPLAWAKEGVDNDTFTALLQQNVRIPRVVMGDLNAQRSACMIGARRLKELAKQHSHDVIGAVGSKLIERSEWLTRQALEKLGDVETEYTDYMDNDGIELEKRIPFKVKVTIRGGEITYDMTGSSPQVRGPFNCVLSSVQAAAYFTTRVLTGSDIPTNAGCFRPIRLIRPAGSIVDPRDPAPVSARTAAIKRLTNCMLSAIRPLVPDRIPADSAGTLLSLTFGGTDEEGAKYVVGELLAGGSGASASADGVDAVETDASNCKNLPVEALEMEMPLRVIRVEIRRGSEGLGRWNGGRGVIHEYLVLGDSVTLTHRGERHYTRARGVDGGGDGTEARSYIIRRDGTEEVIPSKSVTTLYRGDRLTVMTPGGGAWGTPA